MRYELPINISAPLIEAEKRIMELIGDTPISVLSEDDNGPSSESAQKLLALFEEHNEFGGCVGSLHPNALTYIDGYFPIETIVAEFIAWMRQRGAR